MREAGKLVGRGEKVGTPGAGRGRRSAVVGRRMWGFEDRRAAQLVFTGENQLDWGEVAKEASVSRMRRRLRISEERTILKTTPTTLSNDPSRK